MAKIDLSQMTEEELIAWFAKTTQEAAHEADYAKMMDRMPKMSAHFRSPSHAFASSSSSSRARLGTQAASSSRVRAAVASFIPRPVPVASVLAHVVVGVVAVKAIQSGLAWVRQEIELEEGCAATGFAGIATVS